MSVSAGQKHAGFAPAVFQMGFRPFFLGAAIWAALSMGVWIGVLAAGWNLPSYFDPVSWHAHELLFGYLGAVLGGFMMTAVPNWTGRAPIVGLPLAALFGLWLAARVIIALSQALWPALTAAIDLAFPVLLLIFMTRDIIAAGNWRNLVVVALLFAFICANTVFHIEAATGGFAAGGYGLRMGLAAAIMMISLIGGRIIPAFTRNWLVSRGSDRLPAKPMQPFDMLSLVAMLVGLVCWMIWPDIALSGGALLAAGVLHVCRLLRWAGFQTRDEPLLWLLHVGYLFVPLGALAVGASVLWPEALDQASAQHIWMAGGIGVVTLAVMMRATLGHTGRDLTAKGGRQVIFHALILSVALRVLAGFAPDWAAPLYALSGLFWIAAFAGFAMLCAPMVFGARVTCQGQSA